MSTYIAYNSRELRNRYYVYKPCTIQLQVMGATQLISEPLIVDSNGYGLKI